MKRGMKKYAVGLLAGALTVANCMTAFAGSWKQDSKGWWYQKDDGSYYNSGWQWIDGNNDGVSECYYFSGDGYALINTTTPDGYIVNGDGAWTVNGAVQTQGNVQLQQNSVMAKLNGYSIEYASAFGDFNTLYQFADFYAKGARVFQFTGEHVDYLDKSSLTLWSYDRSEETGYVGSDEEVRQKYYRTWAKDTRGEDKRTLKEYNVNGRCWDANIEETSTKYSISAYTYSPSKVYYIIYYTHLDLGGQKISADEFFRKVTITDDMSTFFLNTDGNLKDGVPDELGISYEFTLKK